MPVTSAFRRSVVADTKHKGGGRRGSFYDRYKLPADPAPEAAGILLRGEYVDPNPPAELIEIDPATGRPKPVVNPYHKYKKHTHAVASKKYPVDELCSMGDDPHNPHQCVGCFAMDSGNKNVTLVDQFALGWLHLAFYHGHPLLDQQNQVVMKKDKPSEYVIVFDECDGRTCNFCRTLQGQPIIPKQDDPWPGYPANTITTVFGRKRYMELGGGHMSDIAGIDSTVGSLCGTCGSQLTTDGFACPTCNSLVIDLANDTRTDEQLAVEVSKPYPCLRCQRAVLLREVVSCETCERQGKQGVQLSAFDVVLMAKRQGEGTKSHIIRVNHMPIEQYAQRVDPRYLNGKSLREHITELIGQPYDFAEMFKPRSLQEQSKRLELPMPPGFGGPQTAQYGAYGTQPQAGQQQFYGAPQGAPPPQAAQQQTAYGAPAFGQPPPPPPGYPQPAPGAPVQFQPQPMGPPPGFAPPQMAPGPQPVPQAQQPYFGKQ